MLKGNLGILALFGGKSELKSELERMLANGDKLGILWKVVGKVGYGYYTMSICTFWK